MFNILTIDVEDYFQVNAFSTDIRYEDWEYFECRVERNTHRLLEILDSAPTSPKATFFVLGWVAERYPRLVMEIKEGGHEIASHGCNHQVVSSMSPSQFREDVRKSKVLLEDLTGEAVFGYRAPNYSINRDELWALEILAEEGYRYDSSIYPIHHDTYGMPGAPRFPFTIVFNGSGDSSSFPLHPASYAPSHAQTLVEFPLSTVRMFKVNIPVSGGGYFRLFPYGMVRKGLSRINREEKRPFIFFIHPWEIDYEQPRITGLGFKSRFRHYHNIKRTEKKFKSLLNDFEFTSVRDMIEGQNVTLSVHLFKALATYKSKQ